MSKLTSLCLWLIIALFPVQAAYAFNRIYVDVNNPTPGTGSNWATAYNDLSAALAAGNQADTFWVAQGTYLPTTTGNRMLAFAPKPYQIIYGGFNGTEVFLSQRNWKTNVTILSGNIGAPGIASDNSYNVVRIVNATVDGVTIRDGQADYSFPTLTANQYNTGGGMSLYADAAEPTVSAIVANCTFTNNYAIYGAGLGVLGVASGTATPYLSTKVSKCIFNGNTAYTAGGGISVSYQGACWGNDYTDNSIFIGNKATSGHGSVIANILNGSTSLHRPWMDNVVFWNNGEDLAYNSLANGATGGPYIEFAIIWRLGAKYAASNFSDANIIWHDSDIYVDDASLPSSNINSDPQFVDGPNYDFHVAACSPVIDATILSAVGSSTTDYDGNPRVVKTVDMGIYESTKTISTAPTAAIQYFCQNMDATPLVATGDNLLWYTASSGGRGSSVAPTPLTTATGSTYYYVTQTVTGECESNRTSVTAYVRAQPAAPVVTDIDYCLNVAVPPLTATGTSLLWYTAASDGTGTANAPIPVTLSTGSTTYYVTQTVGCESERAALTVTINTSASPVVSPLTLCQYATAAPLEATGTSLLWYTTASGGTGDATAPTPSTLVKGTTTYYVSQTDGCESARAPLTVTVIQSPQADFTTKGGCAGTPVTVTLVPDGSNTAIYTWNFYNAIDVTGDDPGPYEVLWRDPGDYTVTLITYDGACESTVEKVVSVGVAPEIVVTPVMGSYCINDTVTLRAAGAEKYEWSPASYLSSENGDHVTATFRGGITYTVTGTDAGGCVGTAQVYLGLSGDCRIFYILPTAFSPNGDGLNDVFRVKTSDIPLAFSMRVFNRLGQFVFESHDISEGWSGLQKGQKAPLGAYVYMINAVTSEGKHVEQSGSVVVTR